MTLVERFIQRYSRLPTEFDPDYLEMLRMSKYNVVDVPNAPPGKCANCGASKNDGRRYIDFGLQVEWFGAVFICTHCFMDIANNAGIFEQLQNELQNAKDALLKVEFASRRGFELRNDFEKIFEEVKEYYASLPSSGDDTSPNSSSSVGVTESASEQRIDSTESAVVEPKSRITKSTTSTGSKNVPSLAELLKSDS